MTNKKFPNLKKYPPYIKDCLRVQSMAFNITLEEYAHLKICRLSPSFYQIICIHINKHKFYADLSSNWDIGVWIEQIGRRGKIVGDPHELEVIEKCLQDVIPKIRSKVAKNILQVRSLPTTIEGQTEGGIRYDICNKGIEIEDEDGSIAELQYADLKEIYEAARKFLTDKRKRYRKVKPHDGDL